MDLASVAVKHGGMNTDPSTTIAPDAPDALNIEVVSGEHGIDAATWGEPKPGSTPPAELTPEQEAWLGHA
jgi:hypothetical protein